MGQQMCGTGNENRQFTIKGKSKTGFKQAENGIDKKYVEGKRPQSTNPYVQQKKKLLDKYTIKSKIQNGIKYGPYIVTGSGVVYQGQWHNGQPHGVGELFFNDGSYYYGTFDQGFVHGEGRFISSSKLYYEGQIRRNVAQGKGICINDGVGYTYNGQWMNDLPNGKGKQQWTDGTKYEGDFINSTKNGKGTLTFGVDGSRYTGYFKQNQFEGEGELVLPQGTYKGMFKSSKMNGKGIFKYKNGDIYDGQFFQNKKHGSGRYIKNGKVFQGKWKNGVRQREGYITTSQGQATKGYWVSGVGYYL